MNIMDFANDDNFRSTWSSNPTVKSPWYEVSFESAKPCNMAVITSGKPSDYTLSYYANGKWSPIKAERTGDRKVAIYRFERVWAEKIKVTFQNFRRAPEVAELGVYNERR